MGGDLLGTDGQLFFLFKDPKHKLHHRRHGLVIRQKAHIRAALDSRQFRRIERAKILNRIRKLQTEQNKNPRPVNPEHRQRNNPQNPPDRIKGHKLCHIQAEKGLGYRPQYGRNNRPPQGRRRTDSRIRKHIIQKEKQQDADQKRQNGPNIGQNPLMKALHHQKFGTEVNPHP